MIDFELEVILDLVGLSLGTILTCFMFVQLRFDSKFEFKILPKFIHIYKRWTYTHINIPVRIDFFFFFPILILSHLEKVEKQKRKKKENLKRGGGPKRKTSKLSFASWFEVHTQHANFLWFTLIQLIN